MEFAAKVPDVGNVTLVAPEKVKVTSLAPDVVRLPARERVLPSVPANVMEELAVRVLPSAIVSVADVAGAVMATLLILVALATPRTGVVSVLLLSVSVEVRETRTSVVVAEGLGNVRVSEAPVSVVVGVMVTALLSDDVWNTVLSWFVKSPNNFISVFLRG